MPKFRLRRKKKQRKSLLTSEKDVLPRNIFFRKKNKKIKVLKVLKTKTNEKKKNLVVKKSKTWYLISTEKKAKILRSNIELFKEKSKDKDIKSVDLLKKKMCLSQNKISPLPSKFQRKSQHNPINSPILLKKKGFFSADTQQTRFFTTRSILATGGKNIVPVASALKR